MYCLIDDVPAVLVWWSGFTESVNGVPVNGGRDVAAVSGCEVAFVSAAGIARYGGGSDLVCVVVVLELGGAGGDTAQVGCGEGELPRVFVLVRGAVR